MTVREEGGRITDLFSGREVHSDNTQPITKHQVPVPPPNPPTEGTEAANCKVRLPRSQRGTRTGTSEYQDSEDGPMLFTPGDLKEGLHIVVWRWRWRKTSSWALVVQNHGTQKMRLKRGQLLGMVTHIAVLSGVDEVKDGGEGETCGNVEGEDPDDAQVATLQPPTQNTVGRVYEHVSTGTDCSDNLRIICNSRSRSHSRQADRNV